MRLQLRTPARWGEGGAICLFGGSIGDWAEVVGLTVFDGRGLGWRRLISEWDPSVVAIYLSCFQLCFGVILFKRVHGSALSCIYSRSMDPEQPNGIAGNDRGFVFLSSLPPLARGIRQRLCLPSLR